MSIRSLQAPQYWNHCDGVSNPPDIPSRGRSLSDPATLVLWLNGPDWLSTGVEVYQPSEIMPDECVAEMKCPTPEIQTLLAAEACEIIPVLRCEDFSTLKRLIRVTDHVITFIDTLKLKASHHLNISRNPEGDTSRAEAYWIRINQQQLVSNKDFPVWKHQFGLFLDDHGVWRCKGRLSNANIPEMAKFPILLSSKHHYTDLVVRDCHVKVMHGGLNETLTELRSRYWLIKGRQCIRKVLHNCIICKGFTSKPYSRCHLLCYLQCEHRKLHLLHM